MFSEHYNGAMAVVSWLWFLALFANDAGTIPSPPYHTAKYKTFYIEQPVSINFVLYDVITGNPAVYVSKLFNHCGINFEGVRIMVRVRVSSDCVSYFYMLNTRKVYFTMAKKFARQKGILTDSSKFI